MQIYYFCANLRNILLLSCSRIWKKYIFHPFLSIKHVLPLPTPQPCCRSMTNCMKSLLSEPLESSTNSTEFSDILQWFQMIKKEAWGFCRLFLGRCLSPHLHLDCIVPFSSHTLSSTSSLARAYPTYSVCKNPSILHHLYNQLTTCDLRVKVFFQKTFTRFYWRSPSVVTSFIWLRGGPR